MGKPLVVMVVLSVAAAQSSSADPIQVMSLQRTADVHVSVTDIEGFGAFDFATEQSAATGEFTATVGAHAATDTGLASLGGNAFQHTTVDVAHGHFFGESSSGIDSGGAIGEIDVSQADSTLELGFLLSRPMFYQFTATMAATDEFNVQAFMEPFNVFAVPDVGPTEVSLNGLLAPGQYFFFAGVTTFRVPITSGSGQIKFDLTLQEVTTTPEPTSLALFGTALGGLGLRSRGKRKAHSRGLVARA